MWDIEFSKDPAQKYMYLADGRNQKLHIYDRKSLVELTNFGGGGHYPGEWYSLHSIAVDSKGNLYTTKRTRAAACRNSPTKVSHR